MQMQDRQTGIPAGPGYRIRRESGTITSLIYEKKVEEERHEFIKGVAGLRIRIG